MKGRNVRLLGAGDDAAASDHSDGPSLFLSPKRYSRTTVSSFSIYWSRSACFSTFAKSKETGKGGKEENPTEERLRRSSFMALLETQSEESVEMAFLLLQQMIRQYDGHNSPEYGVPDVTIVEALLKALVENSSDYKVAALQAQTIVDDLQNLYQKTNDSTFQPTLACYRELIHCWSRTRNPQQTERIFVEQLLSPQTLKLATEPHKPVRALLGQCLNHVLSCWVQSGHVVAGKRCEDLLSKLDTMPLPSKGVRIKPNPESHHLVTQAWMKSVEGNADRLYPKQIQEAARRVQENVEFMTQRARASENPEWRPDPECYPWLIASYGRGRAPKEAQALLDRMIQSSKDGTMFPAPTTQTYNSVLEGWARWGHGKEAGMLLSRWVSRCQLAREKAGGDASVTSAWEPDETSCILTIRAWGLFFDHHRAPEAEQILRRMHEVRALEKEYLRVLPAPTTEVYNAVLEAWSRHRHYKLAQAATNAERLLKEMHEETNVDAQGKKYDRFGNPSPRWPNARSYELVVETYARFGYNFPDRKKRVNKLMRRMKHWGISPSERCLELVELCQQNGKSLNSNE